VASSLREKATGALHLGSSNLPLGAFLFMQDVENVFIQTAYKIKGVLHWPEIESAEREFKLKYTDMVAISPSDLMQAGFPGVVFQRLFMPRASRLTS